MTDWSTGPRKPPSGRRFQKGQSGNPGGRSRVPKEVTELARQHTEAAMRVLAECLQDNSATVRLAAAQALLDRAWGKPAQAHTGEGGEGPVHLVIQWLDSTAEPSSGS